MSRPELRTEQKREKDAGDGGDIGRAGILLFSREFLADPAFVARGGGNVESNCEMGSLLSRKALSIGTTNRLPLMPST